MSLNLQALVTSMVSAAVPILKKGASDVETYAKAEFTQIAQRIISIGEQLALGKLGQLGGITEEQADLLLDMQKHASKSTLLTVQGLGLLIVEEAVNAALDAVKSTVNTALGVALL